MSNSRYLLAISIYSHRSWLFTRSQETHRIFTETVSRCGLHENAQSQVHSLALLIILKDWVSLSIREHTTLSRYSSLTTEYSYANSRHSYGFPRIMAVLGDGKTHFDKDNDFDGQTLDACSVRKSFNLSVALRLSFHRPISVALAWQPS